MKGKTCCNIRHLRACCNAHPGSRLSPCHRPSPQCLPDAHDSDLQCIEYCEERDELATCGMDNKVKVWDIKRPAHMKLKLQLDHADYMAQVHCSGGVAMQACNRTTDRPCYHTH